MNPSACCNRQQCAHESDERRDLDANLGWREERCAEHRGVSLVRQEGSSESRAVVQAAIRISLDQNKRLTASVEAEASWRSCEHGEQHGLEQEQPSEEGGERCGTSLSV